MTLIAATRASLAAEDDGGAAIARWLGVDPPAGWPPDHNDGASRAWFAALLDTHPDEPGWGAWYIVAGGRLVGTCGFKGPPDAGGAVEIGYSVVAADRRRGHARAAVELLVARAARDPRVTGVVAETLPSLAASQAVLARSGFTAAGSRVDPVDGPVVRFARAVR